MRSERLSEKAEALRAMHLDPKILLLPNAWDVGSAKLFEQAGFEAIATTSSGIEFSEGLSSDISERRDQMLSVIAKIVRAVNVPVTADIESGYCESPAGMQETISRLLDTGAVGVNLEDTIYGMELAMRVGQRPVQYPLEQAVEMIGAARQAADRAGVRLVINSRTDAFILKKPGDIALADSIRRGNAYLKAGADCVFIPQANDRATIAALVAGIEGPINILGGPQTPPLAELQALGVARVSIGGSLSRAAMQLVKDACEELRSRGTFSYAERAISYEDTVTILGK